MPKSTADIVQGKNIRGAAVGKPKSGKTVNLCSFPGKIMVFDIDRRIDSVLKMHPTRKNIFFEQYSSDQYELLERDINVHGDDKSYGLYILDSMTSLSDMLITYSMKLRGVGQAARTGKAKGVISLSEVEDFGAEAEGLKKVINALLSIDHAHVFITMHILKTTAWSITENKEIVMSSILTGGKKVAAKIPTLFNEIWAFDSVPGIGLGAAPTFNMYTVPTIDVPSAGTCLHLPNKLECTLPKFNLWQQIEDALKKSVPVTPVPLGTSTVVQPTT